METSSATASRVAKALHPPLAKMVAAIGVPTRWQILGELASGEPLMVKEIAERMKCSAALVSKHIAVLKKAGLVEVGRAGMYQIPAHFVVSPQEGHVDFGHCLIRPTSAASGKQN